MEIEVTKSLEGGEMGLKWKQPKVGFAILVLLTAITLAVAYKHNIDYQRYVQETTKRYVDRGINPNILDLWSWHAWGIGGLVTFLVVMTIALWMASAAIWLQGRRNLNFSRGAVSFINV